MRSRRALVTVAALAAATVVAACGGQVSGDAAPSPSRSLTMKAATVTSEAAAPGAGPIGELQDVTGQGVIHRSPRDNARWAPAPEPGALVSTADYGCTLGPAISRLGQAGFLTAEHCVKGGAMQYARVNAAAVNPLALGPAVEGNAVTDSAVIWTETAADDVRVAGTWPVRGLLSVDQVRALPAGATVCFNGAVSGVRCGGKLTGGLTFTTDAAAQQGDSGSESFVVDERGDAWIVGIVSNSPAGKSLMRSVADILDHLHAEIVTAS